MLFISLTQRRYAHLRKVSRFCCVVMSICAYTAGSMEGELMKTRFVHVNIVARNWRKLAQFYIKVFGCQLIEPERDIKEPWLESATNIKSAQIKGAHLRLPGFSNDEGPTLEIFEYDPANENDEISANTRGFGHMAFHVENVEEVAKEIVAQGGRALGELIKTNIKGVGWLTFQYLRDPEGNIVEVQNWQR